MRLLVATTNPGKVREIKGILRDAPVEIVTLGELAPLPEPEETGATFADNARLKAAYYSSATGLPSVAEDSGLEIEALGNLPGVQSARWEGSDYAAKFRKIYQLLRERRLPGSPARFVASVAFAVDGRVVFEARGEVHGEIAPEPRGTNGFGYDPIFFYPPFGCTLAEVNDGLKATVSHRGEAFRVFREYLLQQSETTRRPAPRTAT